MNTPKSIFQKLMDTPSQGNISLAMKELENLLEEQVANDVYDTDLDGMLKKLLDAGIDPNAFCGNKTLMAHFARLGATRAVQMLHEKGALIDPPACKVSAREYRRHTPLMMAASEGKVDVLDYLLFNGADPNLVDEEGHSAIFWAASTGWLSSMKLLEEMGARVDLRDKYNDDLLNVAYETLDQKSEEDLVEIIEWLVEKGLDPYSCGKDGEGIMKYLDDDLDPSSIRSIRRILANAEAKKLAEETPPTGVSRTAPRL